VESQIKWETTTYRPGQILGGNLSTRVSVNLLVEVELSGQHVFAQS
jgi:hypothetical protein